MSDWSFLQKQKILLSAYSVAMMDEIIAKNFGYFQGNLRKAMIAITEIFKKIKEKTHGEPTNC